jgi:hypothetical protein
VGSLVLLKKKKETKTKAIRCRINSPKQNDKNANSLRQMPKCRPLRLCVGLEVASKTPLSCPVVFFPKQAKEKKEEEKTTCCFPAGGRLPRRSIVTRPAKWQ